MPLRPPPGAHERVLVLVLFGLLLALAGRPDPAHAAAPGWVAPLAGPLRVTRPFVPPPGPYAPGHRGVDLAAQPGDAVLAAHDGTVTFAAVLAGRGVVTISHGDLRTTYEPVVIATSVGRHVPAGAVIGRLVAGHPGCPVTACLHWGLLRGAQYLDPLSVLGTVRVRLLPLTGPAVAVPGPAGSPPADPARAAPAGGTGGGILRTTLPAAGGLAGGALAGGAGVAVRRRARQARGWARS